MPFDSVVLGMGNDGHTASFFPQADVLDEALTSKTLALAINAPGADEPRITLTLPTILNTKNLYLHIEGPEKAQTLKQALAEEDVHHMPVRAVLFQNQIPVQVFWCP
jgi:6-phosphogluconolactonase